MKIPPPTANGKHGNPRPPDDGWDEIDELLAQTSKRLHTPELPDQSDPDDFDAGPPDTAELASDTGHRTQDTGLMALEGDDSVRAAPPRPAPPGAPPHRAPAPCAPESCAPALLSSVSDANSALPEYLREVFEAARRAPLPEAANKFRSPGVKMLVALCRQLDLDAKATNGEVFYLSCRVAALFLGMSYDTASRYLGLLQRAGVIVCTVRGSKNSMMASQFHYLGD
jgi:hypothetical protein